MRPQTMTDHARDLAIALGLRPATDADLPFMIEAAARAAWTTDKGLPIAAGIVKALRSERIILPVAAVISVLALRVVPGARRVAKRCSPG